LLLIHAPTLQLHSFRALITSALFFFLLFRRPPISTLFPYTTLFRSTMIDMGVSQHNTCNRQTQLACLPHDRLRLAAHASVDQGRSEEHTSELQSRGHLVCRLLLEKKKRAQAKGSREHHEMTTSSRQD